jgi:hypothetical protein
MYGWINKTKMEGNTAKVGEKELRFHTEQFFSQFINTHNAEYSQWSEQWYFYGELPNKDKAGGCYALFEQDTIMYIGIGIGKNSGLASKVSKFWKMVDGIPQQHYKPSNQFPSMTSIMTIGFEHHVFLAAALQIYLIEQLSPRENTHYKPKK